jgi:hypothetical protein
VLELLIVAAVLVGVVGSGAAIAYASWMLLFGAGLVLIGVGLAVGVPAGLYYHWLLYRLLRPRAPLPPRWWLHPVTLHRLLVPTELERVRRWFLAGAFGFMASVLGCVLTAVGALRAN